MSESSFPDQLSAAFAESGEKVTVRRLDGDFVLIQGNAEALRHLGKLLIAQADFEPDCGFQLSPRGAGSALFSAGSDVGIYVHRTPCKNHE